MFWHYENDIFYEHFWWHKINYRKSVLSLVNVRKIHYDVEIAYKMLVEIFVSFLFRVYKHQKHGEKQRSHD